MTRYKNVFLCLAGAIVMFLGLFFTGGSVSAFSVTPMKQAVSLAAGDSYTGRVTAFTTEHQQQGSTFYYEASIKPLTVNDNGGDYAAMTSKSNNYTDIVNWVTLSNGKETTDASGVVKGSLEPGESVDFNYTIDVPKNARGGGQYFAVVITSVPDPNEKSSGNVAITDNISIISAVFAEISGDIEVSGVIKDNEVPGFLMSPPVTTSFVATNEGNTHSEVTYYMQVFPLFSGEEVYTTEENPGTDYVLPGTTRYIKQTWNEAPSVGIFRVRQTVYYDSTDNEPSVTEKLVIVCPIWLLFLIFFIIIAVIIWIVMRVRARSKKVRKAESGSEA